MTDVKQNLLLFFDRPLEPIFMQKGDDDAVFQIPDHYYPEKYKAVQSTLNNRFGESAGRSVPVRDIAIPDLSLPMELSFQENFSLFVPRHQEMAGRLIEIFMGMSDLEELQSLCSYCQMRINPYMFNYCLSVCILHRPETKGLNIPSFAETFPDKFLDPKVFNYAREITTTVPINERVPIAIPSNFTASALEPEQRIAYFREDIGINLHHWHWHLVYPFRTSDLQDRAIVDKDRRGELFYYMHQQIVARYNAERMCNGLSRVVSLDNFRDPIPEGYFPKLKSQVTSMAWPPRFANTILRDLDRPSNQTKSEVFDLEIWRERFIAAIDNMSVLLPDGSQQPLDEITGIDTLGNMMEASMLSPNPPYYGNMHNMGHNFISYAHDPDNRHLEQNGVMGDSATAMRDPVFYRWHSHIDDLFQLYKSKLPPYGPGSLDFPGVLVSGISIVGSGGANNISTLWEQSTVELKRGLDFSPRGSMLAQFTHLQHEEFIFVIEVNNTREQTLQGTVRLFIAPVVDESGQLLKFEDQRKLMIELDKFTQKLSPGKSTIRRRSVDSSVTIPYERTFRNQANRPGTAGTTEAAEFDFCGCGWPHHMLVPKGNPQGYPMVLFAMVSNWEDDKVEQDLSGSCCDAASYCGIRDKKYPDKRAMGFPFDRPVPNAANLQDFLQPNMSMQPCTIRFADRTRVRGQQ